MKVTIKVQDSVPYTDIVVVAEAGIDAEELDSYKNAGLALCALVIKLRREIKQRVEEEMKARNIVLGSDGLRLPKTQLLNNN